MDTCVVTFHSRVM